MPRQGKRWMECRGCGKKFEPVLTKQTGQLPRVGWEVCSLRCLYTVEEDERRAGALSRAR